MAFGLKQKKVKTKNNYSMETLFEAIKDKEFTPGAPQLVKQGLAQVIAFPQVDRNNQVQITQGWMMGAEGNKFVILKAEAAGAENITSNAVIEMVTGGLSGLSKLGGKSCKIAEQQVDAVVSEFEALDL